MKIGAVLCISIELLPPHVGNDRFELLESWS